MLARRIQFLLSDGFLKHASRYGYFVKNRSRILQAVLFIYYRRSGNIFQK